MGDIAVRYAHEEGEGGVASGLVLLLFLLLLLINAEDAVDASTLPIEEWGICIVSRVCAEAERIADVSNTSDELEEKSRDDDNGSMRICCCCLLCCCWSS